MSLEDQIAAAIVTAFDELGGEPMDAIDAALQHRTVEEWVNQEAAKSLVAGGAEMIIPGLHALTIPAGIAYLLRKMAHICWGIGALKGAYIVEKRRYSDLRNILSIWAYGSHYDANLLDYYAIPARTFTAAANPAGIKVLRATLKDTEQDRVTRQTAMLLTQLIDDYAQDDAAVQMVSVIAGPPLAERARRAAIQFSEGEPVTLPDDIERPEAGMGTRLAGTLAARLASRLPARFVMGFIPLAGAVLNGLFNAYNLRTVAEAAEKYYDRPFVLESLDQAG